MKTKGRKKLQSFLQRTIIASLLIMSVSTMNSLAGEPELELVKTSPGDIAFGEEFELEMVNNGDECEIVETEWSVSTYSNNFKMISSDKSFAKLIPIRSECDDTVRAKVTYTYEVEVASGSNTIRTDTDYLRYDVQFNDNDNLLSYKLNDDLDTVCTMVISNEDNTVLVPAEKNRFKVTKVDMSQADGDYIIKLPDDIAEISEASRYRDVFLVNSNTVSENTVIDAGLTYSDYNGNLTKRCGQNAYFDLNIFSGEMRVYGSAWVDELEGYEPLQRYIKKVKIESGITNIPDYFLYDGSGPGRTENNVFESIEIPDSVKEIGIGAFRGCNNLEEIVIPPSVTKISLDAFARCSNLQKVNFLSTTQNISIGGGAFEDCLKLKTIVMPKNTKVIGDSLFRGCLELEEVDISSATSIKNKAFADCPKLKRVILGTGINTISDTAFENTYGVTIYGYKGTIAETYANTHTIPFASLGNASSGNSGNGGSSSGGGGGGGGGSSSGGSSKKKQTTTTTASLPDYVVKGAWTQNAEGKWMFADASGVAYKNRWAAVHNPYADTSKGQDSFDWFFFDENGIMLTGWVQDGGFWYYLSPVSDGTQGKMITDWKEINGVWYYFNPVSDGTRGKMVTNTWIGNYHLNADGVWDQTR